MIASAYSLLNLVLRILCWFDHLLRLNFASLRIWNWELFGGFLVRVSVTLLSIDFEVRVLFFSLLDEFVLCLSSLCLDGEIIVVWGEKIQGWRTVLVLCAFLISFSGMRIECLFCMVCCFLLVELECLF